jgi:hypothetical protein
MLRSHPALFIGPTLLCLAACATTTFTSTWKAPDGQSINPAGKTIAAVFVSGDERTRHTAEDALANDLIARGARGVPGYTLVPNEIRPDAEDTLARFKKAGASEVIIMRVVSADKRPTYKLIPGSASNGSDSPGTGNLPTAAEHLQFDTLVSVETVVYSLDRNEPLWSGTSRTANPKDIENLVNDVAYATTREMVKQGLLARQ